MQSDSRAPSARRRVLIIAYHFPPAFGSSGLQRSLQFVRHLGENGWEPVVLSASARAYPQTSDRQLAEIPAQVVVRRTPAFDTARHLALGGRYPLFAALPDRWVSWSLSAVPVGWRLVRRLRIRAIVSTYPIATAHLIGWAVHRLTGVPWIADCRDSMTEEHYPEHARVRRSYQWIERKMVAAAQRVVFTTPGALRMYASRYPECSADKWACLPNGYDEESFVAAAGLPAAARRRSGPLLLVHSGIVYPKERDPTQLFRAIADLRQRGLLLSGQLTIRLRAAGHEAQLAALIAQFGVQEFVELADPIPYGDALAEMLGADGLLVLQGASCNHQIPAKLYEYLRAGRPMLALADPSGDTGRLLAETGVKHLAALEDSEAIGATLIKFMQSVRDERPVTAASDAIAKYSRRAQTARLASLLDAITRDQ